MELVLEMGVPYFCPCLMSLAVIIVAPPVDSMAITPSPLTLGPFVAPSFVPVFYLALPLFFIASFGPSNLAHLFLRTLSQMEITLKSL